MLSPINSEHYWATQVDDDTTTAMTAAPSDDATKAELNHATKEEARSMSIQLNNLTGSNQETDASNLESRNKEFYFCWEFLQNLIINVCDLRVWSAWVRSVELSFLLNLWNPHFCCKYIALQEVDVKDDIYDVCKEKAGKPAEMVSSASP